MYASILIFASSFCTLYPLMRPSSFFPSMNFHIIFLYALFFCNPSQSYCICVQTTLVIFPLFYNVWSQSSAVVWVPQFFILSVPDLLSIHLRNLSSITVILGLSFSKIVHDSLQYIGLIVGLTASSFTTFFLHILDFQLYLKVYYLLHCTYFPIFPFFLIDAHIFLNYRSLIFGAYHLSDIWQFIHIYCLSHFTLVLDLQ